MMLHTLNLLVTLVTADAKPVHWENGVIRIARDRKQAEAFGKLTSPKAQCVSVAEARKLLPGVLTHDWPPEDIAGVWIQEGVVVHPKRYMDALWHACQVCGIWQTLTMQCTEASGISGSCMKQDIAADYNQAHVEFRQECICSLKDLNQEYDEVLVAAGAATEAIEELAGFVPMRLCQVCSKYHAVLICLGTISVLSPH